MQRYQVEDSKSQQQSAASRTLTNPMAVAGCITEHTVINNIFIQQFAAQRELNSLADYQRVDVFILDAAVDQHVLANLSAADIYEDPYTNQKYALVASASLDALLVSRFKMPHGVRVYSTGSVPQVDRLLMLKIVELAKICESAEIAYVETLLENAGPHLCSKLANLFDKDGLEILALQIAIKKMKVCFAQTQSNDHAIFLHKLEFKLDQIFSQQANVDAQNFIERGDLVAASDKNYTATMIFYMQARSRANTPDYKFRIEKIINSQLRSAAMRGDFDKIVQYYEPAALVDFRLYRGVGTRRVYFTDSIRDLMKGLSDTNKKIMLEKLSAEHCRLIGEDCISDVRYLQTKQMFYKPNYHEALIYFIARLDKVLLMKKQDDVLLAHSYLLCADVYAKLKILEYTLVFYCLALFRIPTLPVSGDVAEFILASSKRDIFNIIMKFEIHHRVTLLRECIKPETILGRAMLDDVAQPKKYFSFFKITEPINNFQALIIAHLIKYDNEQSQQASQKRIQEHQDELTAYRDFRDAGLVAGFAGQDTAIELKAMGTSSFVESDLLAGYDSAEDAVEYGCIDDPKNDESPAAAAGAPPRAPRSDGGASHVPEASDMTTYYHRF